MLPTPRTEVAVAALEGVIYVAGGFGGDGEASNVVEAYDTRTDRWSVSVQLPAALHHTGMVSIGARLYVVGGYLSDGTSSAGVWSWTVGDDAWRAEPDLPTPRGALAVAAVSTVEGPRIHAIGGASSFGGGRPELEPAHEVYDPARRRWSTAAPFPFPRDHLAAAAIDGDVYVVGGRLLSLERNQARMDVFDAGSDDWRRGPDMPTARGGLAAAAGGGRVFVFGGEEPSGTFEEVEMYEVSAGRWAAAEDLPTPRHGLGAAVSGDRVYVVGGGPTPGLSVSGANETLIVKG